MKRFRYIILVLCATFATSGMAQTAKSAYFLDGTYHNFKLNPAMEAERGFFSIGLGNLTIGANSNVGISDFLYPQGDKLATFMSGSVDQEEFLNRLPQSIRFGLNFDETLMALGFRLFGGYTSFSLSMHSSTSMAMPKGFFEFAKKGLQESSYNFSGINLNTMNYAAATLGYSHEVYKGLRVGVNLKFLTGLAYADATFDKFNVELSEDRWKIEAHAQAQAATFAEVIYDDSEDAIQNIKIVSLAPAAKGFAMDFGAVYDMYEFVPGLTLSASLLDLGKINWQYMMSLENGDTPIEWTGLTDADINDIGGAIDAEFEKLGEAAEKMMELKVYDRKAVATKLGATMYLGAEYNMPFFKPLSVAMLYGKKFSTYVGWDEFRGFINFAPFKWVEASANMGYTTFGKSWGWMFNFHPGWTSFFIGSDYMISNITPQFIPVNDLNYHLTIGVNMPIGKRKSDLKRKKSKESSTVNHTVYKHTSITVIEKGQEDTLVEVIEETQVEVLENTQEEAQTEVQEATEEEVQAEVQEATEEEVQAEVQEATEAEAQAEVQEATEVEAQTEVQEATEAEAQAEVEEETQIEVQENVQEDAQEEVLSESEVTSTTEDATTDSSIQ